MQFTSAKYEIRGWFVMLILLVGLDRSFGANMALAWDPSPDSGVIGYNIHYGTATGSYSNKIDVGNVTTTVISNLNCGVTYYFAATAFNAQGLESDYSNELQFIVPGVLTLTQGSTLGAPMQIKFPVEPAHWYEVQATTNLTSWETIWQTGVVTSNAWVEFSDPQAGEFASRYYRLVLH